MTGRRVALRSSRGMEMAALDQMATIRLWEDALRRSGLPIEPAEGRAARPRFALAAALPPGYTSEAEWLELRLEAGAASSDEAMDGAVSLAEVVASVDRSLPAGLRVIEARFMAEREPSLQSQLRWAEYRVRLAPGTKAGAVAQAIEAFFARPTLPWQETIERKTKRFDLRTLADDLWVEESEGGVALGMRLDASANGTGRPDSVLAGLEAGEAVSKHRTRLVFAYLPQAQLLWRRSGRFENAGRER